MYSICHIEVTGQHVRVGSLSITWEFRSSGLMQTPLTTQAPQPNIAYNLQRLGIVKGSWSVSQSTSLFSLLYKLGVVHSSWH